MFQITLLELQVLMQTTAETGCIQGNGNIFSYDHKTRTEVANRILNRMSDITLSVSEAKEEK